LRERRKEATEGWREGQLAGRGRKQAFAFSVSRGWTEGDCDATLELWVCLERAL